jgi:hypothetical protein
MFEGRREEVTGQEVSENCTMRRFTTYTLIKYWGS